MATKRLTKEEKLFEANVKESKNKVHNCLQVHIFELSTLDSYVRNLIKASNEPLNENDVKLVRLYVVTKCGAKESNV